MHKTFVNKSYYTDLALSLYTLCIGNYKFSNNTGHKLYERW